MIGCDVTPREVFLGIHAKVEERLLSFSQSWMSMAMKLVACNVFVVTLVSYLGRVLMMPARLREEIDASMRRFVLRVPVVRFGFLAHLTSVFGIHSSLQDIGLTNMAALISNALALREGPGWNLNMASPQDLAGTDMHPMRMRGHMGQAIMFFLRSTGSTATAVIRAAGKQPGSPGIQRLLYSCLLQHEIENAFDYLAGRVAFHGFDGETVIACHCQPSQFAAVYTAEPSLGSIPYTLQRSPNWAEISFLSRFGASNMSFLQFFAG